MTYYLSAGATRHEGKRYVRGDELPDELGAKLADRGYAVDDKAKLTEDKRPLPPSGAVEPKASQASTLPPSQTVAQDGDSDDEEEKAPAGTVTVNEAQKPATTARKR